MNEMTFEAKSRKTVCSAQLLSFKGHRFLLNKSLNTGQKILRLEALQLGLHFPVQGLLEFFPSAF
jgi:hypothetical protein